MYDVRAEVQFWCLHDFFFFSGGRFLKIEHGNTKKRIVLSQLFFLFEAGRKSIDLTLYCNDF